MIAARLRPMLEADLELVLQWRNHLDVRQYMYTQDMISLAAHQAWFAAAQSDPQRHLLVYESGGKPQGFAGLRVMDKAPIAEWGFYRAPDAQRGMGMHLCQATLNYSFGELGLHKVQGEVVESNIVSIRFHQKLGFVQEGILRDQFYDGHKYHGIICFGMLYSEWQLGVRGD